MKKVDFIRLIETQNKEKASLLLKFSQIDAKKKEIKEEFLKQNCSFKVRERVVFNDYVGISPIGNKTYKRFPAIIEGIFLSDKGEIVYNLLSNKTGMFLGNTDNKKSFIEKAGN